MEIWKDIDIDGYQVSNFGRVKSFKYGRERILKQHKVANYLGVKIGYPQKNYYTHQLVAKYFLGYTGGDRTIVIDHIDNDKFNNNISNLQIVHNIINTSKDKSNKTGYKSVSKYGDNYISRVTIGGERITIGVFDTPEKAYNAYKNKLEENGIIESINR